VTRKDQKRTVRSLAALVTLLVFAGTGTPELAAQGTKDSGDGLSLAIVQAVCPKQVKTEALKNGTAYGCGTCPVFTSFHGENLSQLKSPTFELRKVLKGSFTRSGANELLGEFFGCEPHAANFGGTMILGQDASTWKRVRWVPGPVGLVRTYPGKDGRDLVLSQGGYMGQGEATEWVSTYDFGKADPATQTLLTVEDDTSNACMLDQVSIGSVSGLEFPDLNGDGKPDLRVKVKAGKAKVPAKYREHCDENFKVPEAPSYTVDFVFDGKAFHVTPSTAAAFKKLNSENQ
jgi:hypothetical protein